MRCFMASSDFMHVMVFGHWTYQEFEGRPHVLG